MVRKILFIFLAFSITLMANIGKIVALKGDITIIRDNSKQLAKLGSAILKSDELHTKNNAKAQLLFNDNTVITIGKNSIFKVQEYLFDDTNKEYKTNFQLLKGTFRTITGKIGKIAPDKFKLNSKTSSIGIRGTQILSKMAITGDKIACIEGEIIITHLKTGQTILIKAGEFVDIGINTKTLTPQKLQQENIKSMNTETRFTTNNEATPKLDNPNIVINEPENPTWGEWNKKPDTLSNLYADPNAKSISSITNPDVIVNATHTATYSGKIDGTFNKGGSVSNIVNNNSNEFKMTVNFGTSNITNGIIKGESTNLDTFTYKFNGTVKSDGTGFNLKQFGNGTGAIYKGTGTGQFYGSNGNIVKGTLNNFDDGYNDKIVNGNFTGTSD